MSLDLGEISSIIYIKIEFIIHKINISHLIALPLLLPRKILILGTRSSTEIPMTVGFLDF